MNFKLHVPIRIGGGHKSLNNNVLKPLKGGF